MYIYLSVSLDSGITGFESAVIPFFTDLVFTYIHFDVKLNESVSGYVAILFITRVY